jgi:hypothetical protein
MDPVMSRPQTGKRPTDSRTRRIVGPFVAFALAFAALIAMPQAARAADVVNVPDANFKAVLNTAIATTDGTTRAPDQDVTSAEALTVTTIDTGSSSVPDAPIATLDGLQAFTNVTSLRIRHTGSTVTDLRPVGALTGLTSLSLDRMITNLEGLETLAGLQELVLRRQNSLTDVSALSTLTQLNQVTIDQSPRLKDVSALAGSKGSMDYLKVSNSGVEDASSVAVLTKLTSLDLTGNKIRDISFVHDMESLTNLSLDNNLIEDVSVLAPMADSSTYKLGNISLNSNRIPDLSPLAAFRQNTFGTYGQSIYVGPYLDGGVPIKLRSKSGSVPTSVTPADAGTYDGGTNRLVSNDPAAPFLDVSGDRDPIWKVYFSEAPDKLATLKLNEVESNDDTANGDWVELYNPASTQVDISGLVVSDDKDTSKLVVPAGTKIPAKGYQTIVTDNAAGAGSFGLDAADSVRIFAGTTDLATATPVDSYTWTVHATATYGRTVPGAGRWTTTSGGTFGAVNTFATAATVSVTGDATSTSGSATVTAAVAKPGSTEVATDATGAVVFAVDGKDVSGPVAVTGGRATYTATGLTGSPIGIAHKITARYVAAGESDPYDSSVPSAEFTVTVTIGEFTGTVALSTSVPKVCETIASDVSGVTPTPDSVTYQWQQKKGSSQVPWSDVSAATGASYPLAYAVVDGQLVAPADVARRLVVTVSKAGYATRTFTSTETANVAPAPFLTTPAAILSTSTPKVGETVTATHPTWTSCIPAELKFEIGYDYQWLRDGRPITGASDQVAGAIGGPGPKKVSYTVTPADAGHTISLQARGNAPGMSYEKAVSDETSTVTVGAFSTSPVPTIDNTSPKVGDAVKASTPPWSPVASMAYQWLRDGAPITGATSASYTVTAADADHALSVKATGTAEGYASTDKTSEPTAKVKKLVFIGSPAPVVAGGTTVGDTLTATVAAWTPAALLSWQWLRDGTPIANATSASYTLTAADQGHLISVRVTGAADGYGSESKTSAATPAVVAKLTPPVNKTVTSKYTVKVTVQSGKKLRLSVTAKGVPVTSVDNRITVRIVGLKGSYKVTVKNGRGTTTLGKKATSLKKGKKVTVTLVLPKLTASTKSSTGTTTYTVAKATTKVRVKLR